MVVLQQTSQMNQKRIKRFDNLRLPSSENNDTYKRRCMNRDSHMRRRCIQEENVGINRNTSDTTNRNRLKMGGKCTGQSNRVA